MSELKHADSFRDLLVYQKAKAVSDHLFRLSKGFPIEETYSLTNQIRRASRSIGAQIAEAWGKRRYRRSFVSKLTDSDAEQLETQHWIHVALSCGYLGEAAADTVLGELMQIGRMLHLMIGKADQFCPQPPHALPDCPPPTPY